MPDKIPTVAQVMPMSVASVKPSSAILEPTAAAVPWPPEKPEASVKPSSAILEPTAAAVPWPPEKPEASRNPKP